MSIFLGWTSLVATMHDVIVYTVPE